MAAQAEPTVAELIALGERLAPYANVPDSIMQHAARWMVSREPGALELVTTWITSPLDPVGIFARNSAVWGRFGDYAEVGEEQ